jgi:hypothetical protein
VGGPLQARRLLVSDDATTTAMLELAAEYETLARKHHSPVSDESKLMPKETISEAGRIAIAHREFEQNAAKIRREMETRSSILKRELHSRDEQAFHKLFAKSARRWRLRLPAPMVRLHCPRGRRGPLQISLSSLSASAPANWRHSARGERT